MDLFDLIPFKSEFTKAYYGVTSNATHTSEQPIFHELKVRRYDRSEAEISEFILTKIDHWVGWNLRNEKKAVGGMTSIRAEVSSFILFGMKINISFGLLEETDINGRLITSVNAKAETQIESRGDLGESRRAIRMMLGAVDFEFRNTIIKEEDYQYRSLDTKGAAAAFQQVFNEAQLQTTKQTEGTPKAKTIEFKKRPAVQTIQLKPSIKSDDAPLASASVLDADEHNELSATPPDSAIPAIAVEQAKPARPKIMIVTSKKTI
ncbi:MAG: hypothetical protein WCL43_03660 [Chlorobium sp.]|jgi:hypothetical protein|nr:MAG: hypothetical protein FDX12_03825 [Chlorobium sp.]